MEGVVVFMLLIIAALSTVVVRLIRQINLLQQREHHRDKVIEKITTFIEEINTTLSKK